MTGKTAPSRFAGPGSGKLLRFQTTLLILKEPINILLETLMIRTFVRVTESNYIKKSKKSNTLFARFFKKTGKKLPENTVFIIFDNIY